MPLCLVRTSPISVLESGSNALMRARRWTALGMETEVVVELSVADVEADGVPLTCVDLSSGCGEAIRP